MVKIFPLFNERMAIYTALPGGMADSTGIVKGGTPEN
jgi:hypothetical protein